MKTETQRAHWHAMKSLLRFAAAWSACTCMALVGSPPTTACADEIQFILDFNLPDVPLLSFYRYQPGSPSHLDSYLFVQGTGGGSTQNFVNWIAFGAPQFNADGLSADIAQTAAGVITICRGDGCPGGSPVGTFNFTSIGLASATNDRTGGQVAFVFDHPDGSFDTSIVTLKPGTDGLQTFSFNEQNLLDVKFFGVDGFLLQFDHIGLSQPAPVPAPIAGAGLPGLILVSGGLFGGGRRPPEPSDMHKVPPSRR